MDGGGNDGGVHCAELQGEVAEGEVEVAVQGGGGEGGEVVEEAVDELGEDQGGRRGDWWIRCIGFIQLIRWMNR